MALDVGVIGRQAPGKRPPAKARLREDRVALRVLRDLKIALHARVPNDKSIILTLGAPIKVPKKLIAALTTLLLDYIQSALEERDERKTVLGNRVRFRVLSHDPGWNSRVIGFVFSGDPAPGDLADSMRRFGDEIAAKAKERMPEDFAGDRWLVLCGGNWIADIKTYRLAFSYLSPARHNFRKILMVFDGGRVEPLVEF
jgi:hypothetical protein